MKNGDLIELNGLVFKIHIVDKQTDSELNENDVQYQFDNTYSHEIVNQQNDNRFNEISDENMNEVSVEVINEHKFDKKKEMKE